MSAETPEATTREAEPGRALEPRAGSEFAPTNVPKALAELGVKIYRNEGGYSVVAIPDTLRAQCNVLDPIESVAQADPNWTPSLRIARLDPSEDGPHFYLNQKKLAPTKQALEVLGRHGGIVSSTTERISREFLADTEEIGYKATVGIRRSDGTVEYITRTKTWDSVVERDSIENDVATGRYKKTPGTTEFDTEVKKRWIKEQRDRGPKTESKAVNRAIRAALGIPHAFTPADAAKPFLVIGYSFTPDYDDEETKRLLVAHGLNAEAAIYGPGNATHDAIEAELERGVDETYEEVVGEIVGEPEDGTVPESAPSSEVEKPEAAATEPEPEPKPQPKAEEPPADAPVDHGATVMPDDTAYPGATLRELAALPDDEGLTWLRWAVRNLESDDPLHVSVVAFLEAEHAEFLAGVPPREPNG